MFVKAIGTATFSRMRSSPFACINIFVQARSFQSGFFNESIEINGVDFNLQIFFPTFDVRSNSPAMCDSCPKM